MVGRWTIWLAALASTATSTWAAAATDGRVSLAVTDLRARGADPQAAAALTTEVSNALAHLGVFKVVTGEDIKRLLSLEETRQQCTGEADAACMAEIGGALGVEFLVYGEVAKLGGTYNLSLALLDTAKASAVNRDSRKISDADNLLEETSRLARALVQPLLESRRGSLVIDVREPGATIVVDTKTAGTAPLGRLELPMGPHEIRVEKSGFLSWARTVEVLPEQVQVEAVTLIPNQDVISAYESSAQLVRTFAWISAGTAVAALGTAGVLRLLADARFDGLVTKGYLEVEGLCADLVPGYNRTDYCPSELGLANDVVSSVSGVETMDGAALTLLFVGGALAVTSVVLFLAGDPPGRYAPFSLEPKSSAGASISVGGVSLSGTF